MLWRVLTGEEAVDMDCFLTVSGALLPQLMRVVQHVIASRTFLNV